MKLSAQDWPTGTVVPGPGGGTLARFGPVVLLVGSTEPDVVRPYLDHAATVAANGGQGRQLVRGFALMLSTTPDGPGAAATGFAALAPHDTGLAVFVVGDVTVTVDDTEVSGADSLAWVERLVPWPVGRVSATLADAAAPAGGTPYRLDEGVVPAGSFLVAGAAEDTEDSAADTDDPDTTDEPYVSRIDEVEEGVAPATTPETPLPEREPAPAAPVWPEARTPRTPPSPQAVPPPAPAGRPVPSASSGPAAEHVDFQSVLLGDLEDHDVEDFEPLPIVDDASQVADGTHTPEEVRGVRCKNRHFNDPRQLFCGVCGINMVQQTPVLVTGTRPPLGVIVLDDGSVFQLDGSYLLGRDPDADERVRGGGFRGLPVIDSSHQVSRVHARLELRGWDVVLVDNNSTNGTYVHVPGAPDWMRMPPGGEMVLVQGTRIRIGHRTLAFNTHAGTNG